MFQFIGIVSWVDIRKILEDIEMYLVLETHDNKMLL